MGDVGTAQLRRDRPPVATLERPSSAEDRNIDGCRLTGRKPRRYSPENDFPASSPWLCDKTRTCRQRCFLKWISAGPSVRLPPRRGLAFSIVDRSSQTTATPSARGADSGRLVETSGLSSSPTRRRHGELREMK